MGQGLLCGLAVEHFRGDVNLLAPGDHTQFTIDLEFSKEMQILESSKDAASLNELAEVNDSRPAILKVQFNPMAIHVSG
jgi:hypothetical protein